MLFWQSLFHLPIPFLSIFHTFQWHSILNDSSSIIWWNTYCAWHPHSVQWILKSSLYNNPRVASDYVFNTIDIFQLFWYLQYILIFFMHWYRFLVITAIANCNKTYILNPVVTHCLCYIFHKYFSHHLLRNNMNLNILSLITDYNCVLVVFRFQATGDIRWSEQGVPASHHLPALLLPY